MQAIAKVIYFFRVMETITERSEEERKKYLKNKTLKHSNLGHPFGILSDFTSTLLQFHRVATEAIS